jgi:hypothetical protein
MHSLRHASVSWPAWAAPNRRVHWKIKPTDSLSDDVDTIPRGIDRARSTPHISDPDVPTIGATLADCRQDY